MNPALLLKLRVVLSLLALPVVADDTLPLTAATFELGENKAFVHAAPESAEGKPWLGYAPTLKGVSPWGVGVDGRIPLFGEWSGKR